MFKENTKYKFKSEKDLITFSEISHANLVISRGIEKAGGVFTVSKTSTDDPHSEFYTIHVDGVKLSTGNNVCPYLTHHEFRFFEEVVFKAVDTDESVDELREGLNFLQGLSSAAGIQFTTAQAVNALDYILKNK